MRRDQREVREAVPSIGVMEATNAGTDACEADEPGEETSMGPNTPPPLQESNLENLTRFSDFHMQQRNYETLSQAFEQVVTTDDEDVDPLKAQQYPHFALRAHWLYCIDQDKQIQEIRTQLLVRHIYRCGLVRLAHTTMCGGQLGKNKTQSRLLAQYFWPGIFKEVKDLCTSCPRCQLTAPKESLQAPLLPLPLVDAPIERIGIDFIGPLEKNTSGHQHILVIKDYVTGYPETIPLRSTNAKMIANELLKILTRVRFPKEVLTDQGTNFTS